MSIVINRPAHMFIKVTSNATTPSQTQDKVTCHSAINEEKTHLICTFGFSDDWWRYLNNKAS